MKKVQKNFSQLTFSIKSEKLTQFTFTWFSIYMVSSRQINITREHKPEIVKFGRILRGGGERGMYLMKKQKRASIAEVVVVTLEVSYTGCFSWLRASELFTQWAKTKIPKPAKIQTSPPKKSRFNILFSLFQFIWLTDLKPPLICAYILNFRGE